MRFLLACLTACLLTMPVLAGCVDLDAGRDARLDAAGADAPGDGARALTAVPETEADAEAARVTQRLGFDADPVRETLWRNDTLAPHEHLVPHGFVRIFTGDAPPHVVDVSSLMPHGVPVHVTAVVTYEANPDLLGSVQARLAPADAEVYALREEYDIGTSGRLDATLMRTSDAPVLVYVEGVWPDASPGIDYTLRVDVTLDPGVLRPLVPVAVDLAGAGAPLRFATPDEGPGRVRVMVWGPDDAFLGHVRADTLPAVWTLPDGAPSGEYVLVASGAPVTVSVPGESAGDGAWRALGTAVTLGAFHDVDADGRAAWTFDVTERVPFAVGVVAESEFPLYGAGVGVRGSVSSAAGTVLAFDQDGLQSPPSLFWDAWWSARGASGLVAGAYEAEVEADVVTGLRFAEALRHHVR